MTKPIFTHQLLNNVVNKFTCAECLLMHILLLKSAAELTIKFAADLLHTRLTSSKDQDTLTEHSFP